MVGSKKLFALILIIVMLLSGCSDKGGNASETPAGSGEDISTATPTAEIDEDDDVVLPAATPFEIGYVMGENLIDEKTSSFENVEKVNETEWTTIGNHDFTFVLEDGDTYMRYKRKDGKMTYASAALDLSKYVTQAGVYTISLDYTVYGVDKGIVPFQFILRTDKETSFSRKTADGNTYMIMPYPKAVDSGEWEHFEFTFTVEEGDVGKGGKWLFCSHLVNDSVESVGVDNVQLRRVAFEGNTVRTTVTQTWVANEDVFISEKTYEDPFHEVALDVVLTNGTDTITVPCFWDGGNIWRVRYALPGAGTWTYTTKCNVEDAGLSNQSGSIKCVKYRGTLDIYKHGFVKTETGTRYFMYDDGTPFFYLGDTHWDMGGEPLENFRQVVDKRVEQSFTVIQSEPTSNTYNLVNGVDSADIMGFKDFDAKFKYIADSGLVHANAQHFFPSEMNSFIMNFGGYSSTSMGITSANNITKEVFDLSDSAKKELELITRYWVARYSAYPVMWTLGQEVDNDFYWEMGNHGEWSYMNNPFKLVAEYIEKYDPYASPLTAHQENTSCTRASSSAFRNVEAHDFYAAQWSPSLTGGSLMEIAMDYWTLGQGKVTVNYEGRYCYLWTKHFGARAQGWMSYLSGMFGYGYGAQDTWCYLSGYSEKEATFDGVDTITPEDKQAATWRDSMEFESAYQAGYMHKFFKNTVGDWHKLSPRFDSQGYLVRDAGAFAVIASNDDNSKIVAYFYNFSDTAVAETPNSVDGTKTGTFGLLAPNETYNYQWFDPIKGETVKTGTFTASASGTWAAGAKENRDMVIYIYK